MLASPGAHMSLSLHVPEGQFITSDRLQFPAPSQVGVLKVPSAQEAVPQTVPVG